MLSVSLLRQHKALAAVGIAVAAPLAGWAAVSAVSHGAFHRSNMATATATSFRLVDRRKKLADPITFENYLLAQAETNEKPVEEPDFLNFKTSIESVSMADMQTFLLNRRERNDRALIYLPGGNFIRRPTVNQWRVASEIARRTRAEVFVPMYPLVPVHEATETHEKVLNLYQLVVSEYGPRNVSIMGDGAGGNVAVSLCQTLPDHDLEQPSHLILISPWADITLNNPAIDAFEGQDPILAPYGLKRIGDLWARNTTPEDPLVSPVNGEVRMLRNVLMFAGTREIFHPDAKLLFDRIAATGIHARLFEGKGLNHDYVFYPLKEANRAIDEIVNAVTED